jgi:hypothetical protein
LIIFKAHAALDLTISFKFIAHAFTYQVNAQFLGATAHAGRFSGAQKSDFNPSPQQERNSLTIADVELLSFDATIIDDNSAVG